MRQFLTVFKFELLSFFRNKTYVLTTIILCLLVSIGLSIPTLVNMGDDKTDSSSDVSETKAKYALYDADNLIGSDNALLDSFFPNVEFVETKSVEDLNEQVKSEKAEAGMIINSLTSFRFVVNNSSLYSSDQMVFTQFMTSNYRMVKMNELNLDTNVVNEILNQPIESDDVILGKDGVSNYAYTYILIFVIYMMIILYGQLVATNIASEKSNRAVEILATSTSSNSLIFGKVLAGASAGIIQIALVISFASISYELNAAGWNHMLDMVFHIPLPVISSFAIFGILGYLFYSFIFGALGALVSKTEDINTSSAPITILFILVFAVTFIGMNDTDGMLLKVASYVPFSSFMCMFVRISMGSVATWEILLSLSILVITTILVGFGAAKIYRRGTLMYGNTIKFKHALKFLKKKD